MLFQLYRESTTRFSLRLCGPRSGYFLVFDVEKATFMAQNISGVTQSTVEDVIASVGLSNTTYRERIHLVSIALTDVSGIMVPAG